jgi:hypothetical protein
MGCGRVVERFRSLEGRHVSVALVDGSRIDDCELVSAGRHGTDSLWLYADGTDIFVALIDVTEVSEVVGRGSTGVPT